MAKHPDGKNYTFMPLSLNADIKVSFDHYVLLLGCVGKRYRSQQFIDSLVPRYEPGGCLYYDVALPGSKLVVCDFGRFPTKNFLPRFDKNDNVSAIKLGISRDGVIKLYGTSNDLLFYPIE
jgi:hypothetical protein